MSNYHILKSNIHLSIVDVAFHIPVPDENNSAGVSLRLAVKYKYQHNKTDNFSSVPNLETDFPTEYSNIQNGVIFEKFESYQFSNANLTLPQKRSEIDNKYTEYTTSIVDDLRKTLKYYRLDRNVP